MSDKVEFIEFFKEALETEQSLDGTTTFRDLDEWDSLASLSVIAMLDEEYGIVIEGDTFSKLLTLDDVWTYVQTQKAESI